MWPFSEPFLFLFFPQEGDGVLRSVVDVGSYHTLSSFFTDLVPVPL